MDCHQFLVFVLLKTIHGHRGCVRYFLAGQQEYLLPDHLGDDEPFGGIGGNVFRIQTRTDWQVFQHFLQKDIRAVIEQCGDRHDSGKGVELLVGFDHGQERFFILQVDFIQHQDCRAFTVPQIINRSRIFFRQG
jgi:hypothetical protein